MGVIYQIVVAGGSRTYIGSAHSLPGRRRMHLHLLRKGKHHSRALQHAFAKYGEAALSWVILETVDDREKLIEREQVWLDQHKGQLYNKSPTAASRLGATMSDEARAKISASLKGNQYRKGILHSAADRAKIGDGVRAAYADGRRKPTPQPKNISAFNARWKSGEILHPSMKPERDALIVADYAITKSLKITGQNFNLTGSAISYAIKRHHERTES